MKNNQPIVAKGVKHRFELCISLWIDLLGYGNSISESGFDPTSKEISDQIDRLDAFQEILHGHADRHFTIQSVNDGAVVTRDVGLRTKTVILDFLVRSIRLYDDILKAESTLSRPGPRAVIAMGFRVRGSNTTSKESNILSVLLKKARESNIPIHQAIYEAYKSRPYFGTLAELHANFAFAKAYQVESRGSNYGFPGPALYVEEVLFRNANEPGIPVEDAPQQSPIQGIRTKFLKYANLAAEAKSLKIRDHLRSPVEIAEALSPDSSKRILNSRIRGA